MTKYSFTISNGETFRDTRELPSDEAAWREAIHTVRDIETTLSPERGEWSMVVERENKPVFRIEVRAQKLG